jgi:hypothetical protein
MTSRADIERLWICPEFEHLAVVGYSRWYAILLVVSSTFAASALHTRIVSLGRVHCGVIQRLVFAPLSCINASATSRSTQCVCNGWIAWKGGVRNVLRFAKVAMSAAAPTARDGTSYSTEANVKRYIIHKILSSRWDDGTPAVMRAHMMPTGNVTLISTSTGPKQGNVPHMVQYHAEETNTSVFQCQTLPQQPAAWWHRLLPWPEKQLHRREDSLQQVLVVACLKR